MIFFFIREEIIEGFYVGSGILLFIILKKLLRHLYGESIRKKAKPKVGRPFCLDQGSIVQMKETQVSDDINWTSRWVNKAGEGNK